MSFRNCNVYDGHLSAPPPNLPGLQTVTPAFLGTASPSGQILHGQVSLQKSPNASLLSRHGFAAKFLPTSRSTFPPLFREARCWAHPLRESAGSRPTPPHQVTEKGRCVWCPSLGHADALSRSYTRARSSQVINHYPPAMPIVKAHSLQPPHVT